LEGKENREGGSRESRRGTARYCGKCFCRRGGTLSPHSTKRRCGTGGGGGTRWIFATNSEDFPSLPGFGMKKSQTRRRGKTKKENWPLHRWPTRKEEKGEGKPFVATAGKASYILRKMDNNCSGGGREKKKERAASGRSMGRVGTGPCVCSRGAATVT